MLTIHPQNICTLVIYIGDFVIANIYSAPEKESYILKSPSYTIMAAISLQLLIVSENGFKNDLILIWSKIYPKYICLRNII